jgi:hypothetical protein
MRNDARLICGTCGKGFGENEVGRKRRFCSEQCKRSAERKIARLDELIAMWERRASEGRVDYSGLKDMNGLTASERVQVYQAEASRLELQLRELLADPFEGE